MTDNCYKCSENTGTFLTNEADLQGLKLKGPGPFTLKKIFFEPLEGVH